MTDLTHLAPPDAAVLAANLEWMRLHSRSPESIYQRHRNITRLAAQLPGPLLAASQDTLLAWRAGLRQGDATIGAYVSHVRSFYAWAVSARLISEDPAAGLPAPPRGRRLPRPIAESQLIDAIEYAPARIRPMLVLAAWSGLRAKEIALLRRENVLDHAAVPVLVIAMGATKGRRERTVPLSPFVLAELRAAGIPGSGWMFLRRDGHPGPNTPNYVSQLCNQWLRECGITATLHQLRHRFGTQAYQATRDLRAVQELMGHSHPSTTAGYAAYDSAAAIEAVSKLPLPGWWKPGDDLATRRVARQAGTG